MSALSNKPTVSVTEWANEHGWRRLRVLLILPFEPFAQLQMDKRCRDRARWMPHRIVSICSDGVVQSQSTFCQTAGH